MPRSAFSHWNWWFVLSFWLGMGATVGLAQTDDSEGATRRTSESATLEWGFGNTVRLGHWTPLTADLSRLADQASIDRFVITCPDSNGVPVRYSGRVLREAESSAMGQALFRLGRDSGRLRLEWLDRDGAIVSTSEWELADSGITILDSTQTTTLVLDPDELLNERLPGAVAERQVAGLLTGGASGGLPLNPLMYDSIDQVFLTLNEPAMTAWSPQQWAALTAWVREGGRLVLAAGPGAAEWLQQESPLSSILPGRVTGVAEIESSSRLSFFTGGSEPLIGRNDPPLKVLGIEPEDAVVRLEQNQVPVLVQAARGLGVVTLIPLDISEPRYREWNDGFALIGLVLREVVSNAGAMAEDAGRRVSHNGYEDLVGQLRVPLDQFRGVEFIYFTWVAVLIGVYILLVGPGDYFFLRNVVGRMEWTWVTFTLVTALFCGLAWWGNRWSKPTSLQINQLEIVDVDVSNQRYRTTVWANVYGPQTTEADLALVATSTRPPQLASGRACLAWQGLPGRGLGGMRSRTVADFSRRAYEMPLEIGVGGEAIGCEMENVPFQVSSSRAVFGRITGDANVELRNRLRYNTGTEQIEGTITNPLDVELRNCRILFGNWVYVFEQPMGPGETIDLLSETREKNLKSFMTRRQGRENKGANTPWDPTDTDVGRIANMMMFYGAAGGASYTSLTHDYQPFIDMTGMLELNRAILVGEAAESTSEVTVAAGNLGSQYDQHFTLFRFVIPIEEAGRRGSSRP